MILLATMQGLSGCGEHPLPGTASTAISAGDEPQAIAAATEPHKPAAGRSRPPSLLETQELPDLPADELARRLNPAAAAGDPRAASQLYLVLARCRYLARNAGAEPQPQQVDRALLDRIKMSEQAFIAHLEASTLAGQEKEMEACQKIPAGQIEQAGDWLRKAAAAGDPYAQLIYIDRAEDLIGGATEMLRNPGKVARFREDAIAYLRSASAAGSPEAMSRLSSAYLSGGVVDRDPVVGYAYALAAAAAANRAVPADVRQLEAQLTPSQLAQGRGLAKRLAP
ncbi:MAG TPA: hypothetical protein VM687_05695 [Stenotrophomonas sp.]|nr:hypothetical protein [Stenotrophomonas sp.]